MAWYRPISGFGRPLGDDDIGGDVTLGFVLRSGPGFAQRAASPQRGDEFAFERSAPFDVKGLVDRFVTDPHALIIGEIDFDSLGDLFRTPCQRPRAVAPARLVPTPPRCHRGTIDERPVRQVQAPVEALLDVLAQSVVAYELRGLRATGEQLGFPLRGRGSVLEFPAPGRRVPA